MDDKERQGNPATNAALSRRGFLRAGAAVGAMAAGAGAARAQTQPDPLITEVQPWASGWGDGVDATPYGLPIEFEDDVIRRNVGWLTADTISSINFTPIHALDGTITPTGCAFERHHSGAIELKKEDYRLMINGLVDKPLVFTYEDLERFPRENRTYFLECAANSGMEWAGAQLNGAQFTQGMIHNMQYSGIPLRTLLEEAGITNLGDQIKDKWVYAEGADASSNGRSIPLEKALDDCLVAIKANGEALRKEHGYPVRLVVPGWEGNMWVKWLRRIEVGDESWQAREETSKYTDLMPDGRARRFTWEMDCKSVITSPCPENPLTHKGPNVISGLAWSGRGTVKRVDVSLDGGKNWVEARIEGPVMPKCLTRFYLDGWEWDGSEVYMQSRAIDDTGYVQPQMTALQKVRGINSIYHNNAIQTWFVNKTGEVENVRLA